MAIEAIVEKTNGRLSGATMADAEMIDTLASNISYRAKFTRLAGRSLLQHRLLFGLIKVIRDNTPVDPPMNSKTILNALKLKTGHVDLATLPNGEILMFPASIAFENMEQDDFTPWFDKAVDVMCRDFVPGLNNADAKREIIAIAEGKWAA